MQTNRVNHKCSWCLCLPVNKSLLMSREDFANQKKQILCASDLSKKGSIDLPIQSLVEYLNNIDEYVTTSSCSGRIIVFCEDKVEGHLKKGCKWLYTSHDVVEDGILISKLDPTEGNIILKFEPFILHVQCYNLDAAKLMLTCALESGFKNSGLVVGKHGKVVLAVRSCLSLEVPLSNEGSLLVSEEYLKYLVTIANDKLTENLKRTEKFHQRVRELFHNQQLK
ncbi:hypothetical protein J437_LFUL015744 [Ladona fulva]|uniref:tRNA wybutosine-synthesizing protein 3 homolog n=1 Tax=Ladona fulva TaxID=123851 RepID=A0A8K0KIK1_LADFU|nr:hypothetical protein J437_LFUL015744 [Ladona fulva]